MITWFANGLFIFGVILLGRKNKWGWICEAIGECLWIERSISTKQWDLLFLCVMFCSLQIYNFFKWLREERRI